MPQLNLYEQNTASESEMLEQRYDVLPLRPRCQLPIDRFCLAQTLSLARQRQLRRPLSAKPEQNLLLSRNWAVRQLPAENKF